MQPLWYSPGRDHSITAPMQAVPFLVLEKTLVAQWSPARQYCWLYVQLCVFRKKKSVSLDFASIPFGTDTGSGVR